MSLDSSIKAIGKILQGCVNIFKIDRVNALISRPSKRRLVLKYDLTSEMAIEITSATWTVSAEGERAGEEGGFREIKK